MTSIARAAPTAIPVLGEVERRVLWLSTAIIHHANRVRPNPVGHEGRRPPSFLRVDGLRS